MKKIILALMLLTSFSFSAEAYTPYKCTDGKAYQDLNNGAIAFSAMSYNWPYCADKVQTTNSYGVGWLVLAENYGSSCDYRMYSNVGRDCDSSNFNPQTGEPNPPPDCPSGSHADGQNCVGDYPLKASTPLESGATFSLFEDGATMYCRPNGECETTNDKGERIPNRFVNGAIPSEISDLKDFGAYLLSKVGNAVGKTLQWGGMTMLLNGTAGGALIYEGGNPALNGLNPVFLASAGLISLGNALVTEENVVLYTPKVDGVLNVDIVEKTAQTSTANLDASTPSDGSPVLSENGAFTQQQITAQNAQTIWDTAGGVGKLPPNALVLGSDITYPSNNPDKAIVNTPDAVIMVKTNSDGSSTIVKVNKNDIANTQNHNTDLIYEKQEISPEKITNDGKTEQTQITTPTSVSPLDNFPKTTNPKTGLPDYVDYDPRTGLKDGKVYSTATGQAVTDTNGNPLGTGTGAAPDGVSPLAPIKPGVPSPDGNGTGSSIDLKGVTSRLDKISNQLTVQNKRDEELDNLGGVAYLHGLPTGTNPYDWTSYQGTFDNLKSTIDNLNGQFEEMKSLFQNGFTLNLSGTPVDTCPYNSTIDLDGRAIAVSFDLCKTFSPMRPLFHGFFYLFFVFVITSFGVKSILRFV